MATTLTCTACEELIALAALGVLGTSDVSDMEAHLRTCPRCPTTARAFRVTAATLAESVDLLEPPAALRRRLLAAVYSSSTAGPQRRLRIRELWQRLSQRRILTPVAALATAAAVAFGILATRTAAPARPNEVFPVTAAAGQPVASGDLTYYPNTSTSVLVVRGLAPSGSPVSPDVYELWLISAAGSAEPVAFLAPSPDRRSWVAVVSADIRRFQALAATIEPPGGTSHPTGPQVFSVALDQV